MKRTLTAVLAIAALTGCGSSDPGSDSKSSTATAPKPTASAPDPELQVLRTGDLEGVRTQNARAVESAIALAAADAGGSKEAKRLAQEDFETGYVTDLVPVSEESILSGYSTAERFRDAAGAKAEMKANLAPSAGDPFTKAKAAGLPQGSFVTYRNPNGYGRNVYFVRGRTLYFTGFSNKAKTPDNADLLAAAKKVLARAGA